MAWVKVPPEHRPVFEAALPKDKRVTTMQMFGGLAALVNGNMFAGLFGRSAIVRLHGKDHDEALALEGASRFDPMGNGRVSKDTVMLPEDVFHDDEELRAWLARALAGAAKLPPKAKESAKNAKPSVKARTKPPAKPLANKRGSMRSRASR